MRLLIGMIGSLLFLPAPSAGALPGDEQKVVSIRFVTLDASGTAASLDRARLGETVWVEVRYDPDPAAAGFRVGISGAGETQVTVTPVAGQPGLYRGALRLQTGVAPPVAEPDPKSPVAVAAEAGATLVATPMSTIPEGKGRLIASILDAAGAPSEGFIGVFAATEHLPNPSSQPLFWTDHYRGTTLDLPPGSYHLLVRRYHAYTQSTSHSSPSMEWIRDVRIEAGATRLVEVSGKKLARILFEVKNATQHDVDYEGRPFIAFPFNKLPVDPRGFVDVDPGTYTVGYNHRRTTTTQVTVTEGERKRVLLEGEPRPLYHLTSVSAPVKEGHGRIVVSAQNSAGGRIANGYISVWDIRWRRMIAAQSVDNLDAVDLPAIDPNYLVRVLDQNRTLEEIKVVVESGKVQRLLMGGPGKLGRLIVRAPSLPPSYSDIYGNRRYSVSREGGGHGGSAFPFDRAHDIQAGSWIISVSSSRETPFTGKVVVPPGRLTEFVLPPLPESLADPATKSARLLVTDDRPDVRFVRRVEGSFVPVEDPLLYGEPFFVEARYPDPPAKAVMALDLSWGAAETARVSLYRTPGDPRLYRSARIDLQLPAKEGR